VYINVFGRNSDTPSISGHPKASTNHATMLRLRPCGGKAPASVHALFRARLPRPASSTAYAVAASSALEELAAERKGRPLLPTISASFHRMLVGSRLASHLIPLRAFVHMVKLLGSSQEDGRRAGPASASAKAMASCLLKCPTEGALFSMSMQGRIVVSMISFKSSTFLKILEYV
jgi:hypothetical protein